MEAKTKIFNPYPGLRPFDVNESNLFFSREEQTREIISKLTVNRFIALTGPSGSGKSSLISSGIIPALTRAYDTSVPLRHIILSRPGNDPVGNLARAMVDAGIYYEPEKTNETLVENAGTLLQKGPEGIDPILNDARNKIEGSLVIIIDCFEELFLLKETNLQRTPANEQVTLTSLIIELQKQEVIPLSVLIAVRSDFISECHEFPELSRLINRSNHFLSPMTNQELHDVIHKPAAIGGGQIDASLERQILDDLHGKPDLLPSLQYVLNKVWDYWMKQGNYEKPLSLQEYQAVGDIYNAISADADRAYEELSWNGKSICKRLFKTIAAKDSHEHYISCPRTVAAVASVAGAGVEETIEVIDRFRQPGSSFIETSDEAELNPDTIIELSHESLIRLWQRLNTWVEEEAESIKMYKHLAERSRLYQIRKASLLVNPELQVALKWREENKPSTEWAKWHNPAFGRTMTFLEKSEEYSRIEEEYEFRKPLRKMRRVKIAAVVFGIAAIFSIGIVISNSIFNTPGQSTISEGEQAQTPEQIIIDQEPVLETDDPEASLAGLNNETELQQFPESDTQNRPTGQGFAGQDSPRSPDERVRTAVNREADPDSSPEGNHTLNNNEGVASEEELKNRLADIGRSLAASSPEIGNDPYLTALLAVQAQNFLKQAGENTFNPGLYKKLHSALKAVFDDSFNSFNGHSGSVNSVIFRPNSSIFYSASSDGKVLRWDLDDNDRAPVTLLENNSIVNKLAISSNGQWLAVATNGQGIRIFNPARNVTVPVIISRGNNRFISIDFHPDNQHLIFADSENNIVKYNIITNNSQFITTADSEVFSLSVSPDGRSIAAGTRGGQVIVWTGETDPVRQIIHHEPGNDIHVVQFNQSGTQLASGTLRGYMRIWEVSTGNLVTGFDGHSARVVDIKYSPDNNKLASTSFDGTIKLWDINNFDAEPLILSDHGSWVLSVSFNSAGNRLVSGGRQENRLLSWYLDTGEMAREICSAVNRKLATEEWNRYIGEDIPYMETCAR